MRRLPCQELFISLCYQIIMIKASENTMAFWMIFLQSYVGFLPRVTKHHNILKICRSKNILGSNGPQEKSLLVVQLDRISCCVIP